jgi:hypothetical protein
MRKILSTTIIVLLFIGLYGISSAAPWYQPTDLSDGDQYQLIFVISEYTWSTSQDLSYYLNFVNDVAANNSDLAQFTWRPVISLENIPALALALVLHPVYNLNGDLIANDRDDMWDGDIESPVLYRENRDGTGYEWIWTGTTADGFPDPGSEMGNGSPRIGWSDYKEQGWIESQYVGLPDNNMALYALSDPITVVPLPGAIWLLGVGFVGIAGLRRKLKR